MRHTYKLLLSILLLSLPIKTAASENLEVSQSCLDEKISEYKENKLKNHPENQKKYRITHVYAPYSHKRKGNKAPKGKIGERIETPIGTLNIGAANEITFTPYPKVDQIKPVEFDFSEVGKLVRQENYKKVIKNLDERIEEINSRNEYGIETLIPFDRECILDNKKLEEFPDLAAFYKKIDITVNKNDPLFNFVVNDAMSKRSRRGTFKLEAIK
ncbi:MAG: hypothetical protein LBR70_04490 [Lactobacillaceae bacterium]|jgi:hypothetical protein|nr:hypothetical protein [Lactobacillaceae bacterium]